MRFLDRLEPRLRRYGVPNVTAGLVAAQVLTFGLAQVRPAAVGEIVLVPDAVLAGEWWRVVTFLAMPPSLDWSALGLLFLFFGWYLFFLMGNALEGYWGAFRYNVYLLVGYVATVAAAFLNPHAAATNVLFESSVFLAFAHLYPNFELRLFFVLPVKIKWLSLLTWLGYAWVAATGDWSTRAMTFAAVSNFLLFSGGAVIARGRTGRRRMATQARRFAVSKEPPFRHKCATCGITDKTHPRAEFRYCSRCVGGQAYCEDHLKDHSHVTEPEASR